MRVGVTMLAALLATGAADAQGKAATKRQTLSAAYFLGLQEVAPFTPEALAERRGELSVEGSAADLALNEWKLCTLGALKRWAPIKPGPGTLVDGAFGLCADAARAYREALLRLTQDGRPVMDPQLARQMTRSLEDSWRPRLIAAALDQELAATTPPAPVASVPAEVR